MAWPTTSRAPRRVARSSSAATISGQALAPWVNVSSNVASRTEVSAVQHSERGSIEASGAEDPVLIRSSGPTRSAVVRPAIVTSLTMNPSSTSAPSRASSSASVSSLEAPESNRSYVPVIDPIA